MLMVSGASQSDPAPVARMEQSEPDASRALRAPWLLLSLAALFSAAVRGVLVAAPLQNRNLLGAYWIGFYSLSYGAGDRRRALVGSVFHALRPDGLSLSALNLFALMVLALLFAVALRAFWSLPSTTPWQSRVFQLAILGGVLASIQWEVIGDLLQVDLVLFFLTALALRRWVRRGAVRLIVGLVLLVPLAMIHEAAIFLFMPFLPYLVKRRPSVRDYLIPVLAAMLLFGGSLLWSKAAPGPSEGQTRVSSPADATAADQEPTAAVQTPSFSAVMHAEIEHDFGNIRLFVSFGSRCLRILFLFVASLCAFAVLLPANVTLRFVQLVQRGTLLSLPLWFIAHDWGRFLSYVFTLSLFFAVLFWTEEPDAPLHAPGFLAARLQQAIRVPSVQIAAFAVLLLGPGHEARVSGMDFDGFLSALPFVGIAAWQVLRAKPTSHFPKHGDVQSTSPSPLPL